MLFFMVCSELPFTLPWRGRVKKCVGIR